MTGATPLGKEGDPALCVEQGSRTDVRSHPLNDCEDFKISIGSFRLWPNPSRKKVILVSLGTEASSSQPKVEGVRKKRHGFNSSRISLLSMKDQTQVVLPGQLSFLFLSSGHLGFFPEARLCFVKKLGSCTVLIYKEIFCKTGALAHEF